MPPNSHPVVEALIPPVGIRRRFVIDELADGYVVSSFVGGMPDGTVKQVVKTRHEVMTCVQDHLEEE